MNVDEFRATLGSASPPVVPPLLSALWHDARGNWDQAHRIAQDVDTADGAWVHAYLHRREGDAGNAATGISAPAGLKRPTRSTQSRLASCSTC